MKRSPWTPSDPVSKALLQLAASNSIDHDTRVEGDLLELARRHGLIGLLHESIDHPMVKAIHARQMARQDVMRQHLHQILEVLAQSGLRGAVLKGPAIAAIYPHRGARPFSDLDLLVEAESLEAALAVIGDYEHVVEVPEKRPKASKRDVLIDDPSGVRFNLDLHWDMFSYTQFRGAASGATDAAWDEAVFDPLSDLGPQWHLPDRFRFGFLAAHATLDHRFRVILFRDLAELSRAEFDWGGVVESAERYGLRSTSYLAGFIANGATGGAIPSDVLRELRPTSLPVTYLERALPSLDIIRFDGHAAHPINLATVLLNDSASNRLSLLARAPAAFPRWHKRVAEEHRQSGSPRTLIVVSTDRRRGAEIFTERLRDGLTRRGWVVDAVALRASGSDSTADVEPLTEPDDRKFRRVDPRIVWALRRKIRSYRPAALVANGGATLRYSIAARVGLGVRLVYMAIGEPSYWIRSRVSRWVNRWMLRRVDLIVTVSEETRRQLIDLEPSTSDKSVTLYTGLEESLMFRERPHREDHGLRVVMLGSLTEEKDPLLALEAVAKVPGATLRFVGDGDLRSALEGHARRLNASDRVEFTGSVDDVLPHLDWGDVLILTSKTEGLPGAILEASAVGLAVVAVDVGGVREAVVDGETGLVVRRDVASVAGAIRRLDADRPLMRRMGVQGREHVRSRFRLDQVVEAYGKEIVEVAR